MRNAGWMIAGFYYWTLAKMNRQVAALTTQWFDIKSKMTVTEANNKVILNRLSDTNQKENFRRFLAQLAAFIQEEKLNLSNYYQAPRITASSQPAEDHLDVFSSNSQAFQKRMRALLNSKQDPMMALSTIGEEFLRIVQDTWQDIAQKNVALQPILVAWMILNFTLGSVLVYYVPFIPFFWFFFGSLSWLGSVIGAVLAAPLVALGLMHPEGHDFFGQSEQAVRLLAILFLKPMLMIFGLIFGMTLCAVAFELFHYSYLIAVNQMPMFNGTLLAGVDQTATTTVYTTVAINIVTRCFALIYEIPNRVFSWIGWQTEGHSEAEVLGQVKGGLDQSVGGIGHRTIGQGMPPPVHGSAGHNPPSVRIEPW